MGTDALSLYVHFPWCVRKCPYCDFNSHPQKGPLDESAYLDALLEDLEAELRRLASRDDRSARTDGVGIRTIFFGGGTPSLFSPAAFERILRYLRPRLTAGAEVTMEANPGTTEHHELSGYREAGINRLSFGAQSFDDAQLKSLGRIHGAEDTVRSFEAARRAGFDNINLDLMYGLPRQTPEAARADIETAIELGPEHLSWYQLTIEPRTEFARRPPILPRDATLERIAEAGYALLSRKGYQRYEVSAYARAGARCAHNLNYWTYGDYLGIGAGAHGKLTRARGDVVRTSKARQPRLYLANPADRLESSVDPSELPAEFMLNVLRLVDGVALEAFESRTGLGIAALEPTRTRQIENGLLRGDRLATTARGYALLDAVVRDYV